MGRSGEADVAHVASSLSHPHPTLGNLCTSLVFSVEHCLQFHCLQEVFGLGKMAEKYLEPTGDNLFVCKQHGLLLGWLGSVLGTR